MARSAAKATRTAHSQRGARTREQLLDGAIRVIAKGGLESFSHRAVAKEAGLAPALTTYYFADKAELLAEAFRRFAARGAPGLQALWGEALSIAARLGGDLSREQALDALTHLAADYICLAERPALDGVAFELAFFYAPHLEPELADEVRAYRRRLHEATHDFCVRAGSAAPATDAELLVGAILRLEFEQLSALGPPPRTRVEAQIRRLLGAILSPEARR